MTRPPEPRSVRPYPLAAAWMAAAAYTVGHGPELARPLGLAYAHCMLRRDGVAAPLGPLRFAGLGFGHPRDTEVVVCGRFTMERYRKEVIKAIPRDEPELVDCVNDYLTRFNIEELDTTDLAWCLMLDATSWWPRGWIPCGELIDWVRKETAA